eukprot:6200168-Prymnesium_polylepis.1
MVRHLPHGHAALPDHAGQRTSAGSTCASGTAPPPPALSPPATQNVLRADRAHLMVLRESIAPCAHLDSACAHPDS